MIVRLMSEDAQKKTQNPLQKAISKKEEETKKQIN